MKTSLIPIVGLPLTGVVVLNSLSIDKDEYHNTRLVEVYFYDNKTSGTSEQKSERIKVWIESLEDFSKYQFYKNDDNKKWLKFTELKDNEEKKYLLLAKIAKYFFENQHALNIAKAIYLTKDENKDAKIECPQSCTKKEDCCLKDCPNLVNDHRRFYYHLSNLENGINNSYLSPVQAHINLGEIKLDSSESNQKDQQISGSLVYGYVDYQYKETNPKDWEVPKEQKDFYKLTDASSGATQNNKKYFANYPTTWTVTLDKDLKIKEDSTTENDLHGASKKLGDKNELGKLLKDKKDLKLCCCVAETKTNTLDCLLGSNFVKLEEKLETVQGWVKDKASCKQ